MGRATEYEMTSCINNPENVQSPTGACGTSGSENWTEMPAGRKRFQNGTVTLRGKKLKVWTARWLEDFYKPDGSIERVRKSEILGTIEDLPAKKDALRALRERLSHINSSTYKPKFRTTFTELSDEWLQMILPNHKPSSRPSTRAHVNVFKAYFGKLPVSELSAHKIQRWLATVKGIGPKTKSNYIKTLRMMWNSAKAWGYVTGDPFDGVVLPERGLVNAPSFSIDEAVQVVRKADEPAKTMFWILAETGMRGGELCGLFVSDIDLDRRIIKVQRSAWRGKLQTPKSKAAVRMFDISVNLSEHLRSYIRDSRTANAGELLFPTSAGTPYDNSNIVRYWLTPILKEMGIKRFRLGLHGFRHSNISVMDSIATPMKVRQERVGHSDSSMTMEYTIAASVDHRIVADKLGEIFDPRAKPEVVQKTDEDELGLAAGAD